MRLHVITNHKGEVIATARAGRALNGIEVNIKPVVEGHRLYEAVEVPDELGRLTAQALHERLRQHLPK